MRQAIILKGYNAEKDESQVFEVVPNGKWYLIKVNGKPRYGGQLFTEVELTTRFQSYIDFGWAFECEGDLPLWWPAIRRKKGQIVPEPTVETV